MELFLVLPLPISLNQLYQNQFTWNKKFKQYMPSGKRIMTKEGKMKKFEIQREAKKQLKGQEWDKNITQHHFIYQDMNVYFNRRGRDSDNLLKLLNDSLEGFVFHDDSKVLTRTQRILFDYSNPRVELSYSIVPYVGVYDNLEHFQEFEMNCQSCRHYRNGNCSILTDSFEGKVREEINEDFECIKYVRKKATK